MKTTRFPAHIFREYDIRGLAQKDLSEDLAYAIGHGYSVLFREKNGLAPSASLKSFHLSVGQDCRLTSEAFASALSAGLADAGFNVIRLGVCPTPLTYFSVFHRNLDGAVMVTGSHNPAEYNGFKILIGRDTLHGTDIQKIREILEKGPEQKRPTTPPASVKSSEKSVIAEYIAYLKKTTPALKRKLKLVLDAGNGTASNVAPELFSTLGVDVIPLYCELDGRFPNHHPDPTVPENLRDLAKAVVENQADFGIGFDGDSDRIGVVDENGKPIYGDDLMVILSRSVLKENPGATILSEVKSSYRLYDAIAKAGGVPIMWKTGHSLIKQKMKESGALLAGEMSGHIFFKDRYFGFDDALYAGVRLAEIVSASNQPFSSYLADLEKTFCTPEIRVDCQEELKFGLIEEMKKHLKSPEILKLNTIDGIRADFKDGWGLVRASNTQPVLVFRFEGKTHRRISEIRELFVQAIGHSSRALDHPPIHFPPLNDA